MKKQTFGIKKTYIECKNTLFGLKNYFIFSLAFFCFFIIIGFALPIFFRSQIINVLLELSNLFDGKGVIEVIFMIFYNNAKASLFSIILGIFFGIFPLAVLLINGYLVGFTARLAVEEFGLLVLWRIVPHGIFELPAILISTAIGIRLGFVFLNGRRKFGEEFRKAIRFYLFVIIPLLFVAAVIEGFLVFFI